MTEQLSTLQTEQITEPKYTLYHKVVLQTQKMSVHDINERVDQLLDQLAEMKKELDADDPQLRLLEEEVSIFSSVFISRTAKV